MTLSLEPFSVGVCRTVSQQTDIRDLEPLVPFGHLADVSGTYLRDKAITGVLFR